MARGAWQPGYGFLPYRSRRRARAQRTRGKGPVPCPGREAEECSYRPDKELSRGGELVIDGLNVVVAGFREIHDLLARLQDGGPERPPVALAHANLRAAVRIA